MPENDVILFLTHQWSPAIAQRFARLFRETRPHADCFLLLQDDAAEVRRHWLEFLPSVGAAHALHPFSPASLPKKLGYPYLAPGIVPGSAHFPLLDFRRTRDHANYWLIESDVEYRGNWGAFIEACRTSPAALLGAHIRRHCDQPAWFWWRRLSLPAGLVLPADALRKAFLPIYRISDTALHAVDAAHRAGWRGHCEVILPTVLNARNLSLMDFRTIMPCIEGQSQDPCNDATRLSTLRWRPNVTPGEFAERGGTRPLLFHPVKGNWHFDGEVVRRLPPVARGIVPAHMPETPA